MLMTRELRLAIQLDNMLFRMAIRSEYVRPFTEAARRRMGLIRTYRRDALMYLCDRHSHHLLPDGWTPSY